MSAIFFNQKNEPAKILKWLFLLSGTALSGLLSVKGSVVWILACVPCAFVALWFVTFRFRYLERVFAAFSRRRAALSLVLALYAAHCYTWIFQDRLFRVAEELGSSALADLFERFGMLVSIAIGIVSILALFVYLYWFWGWLGARIRKLSQSADSVERRYLLLAMIAAIILIPLIYHQTTVFYSPNGSATNVWDKIDIVYSSDTASLVEQNVFLNIGASENDIRQPLFGVFAAPFALLASLTARLLYLPGLYPPLLQIVQAFLLFIAVILIGRVLRLSGIEKALFLSLSSVTYPALLFLLNMEQYIFPVFWLTLLIWQYLSGDASERDDTWIAASGSMLTSGVFVLLVPRQGALGGRIRACLFAICKFAIVMLLFGRAAMVISSAESIRFLTQFAGERLVFLQRLLQYSAFVSACFVAPAAQVVQYASGISVFHQSDVLGWSIAGVVLFAASTAGFIVQRKNAFARICFGWVLFSFLLLCVVGWGTFENGLVLYTLYFSWAFLSLIVLLIQRVFRRQAAVRITVLSAGIAALLVFNLQGIAELLRFGIQYYPVR